MIHVYIRVIASDRLKRAKCQNENNNNDKI